MSHLDLSLFHLINGLAGRDALLDTLMLSIAKYGPLVFGLILLHSWFKGPKQAREENRAAVVYAVCSALIALGINQVIGHLYFRPRPYADHTVHLLLDRSPDPSFPSDHATGGFSLASTLFLFDARKGTLSLIFAALLAFSRVYVGAHYPLDVVGGAFTGLVATAVVRVSRKRLEPATRLVVGIMGRI